MSKLKKVSRGIQGEKSSKDTASSVKVKSGIKVTKIGGKSDRLGSHCYWSRVRMSFYIRERETSYC